MGSALDMPPSTFLQLPVELREKIYAQLLTSVILENRTCGRFIEELHFPNSFIPARQCAAEKIYAILLTCHQCYYEGIRIYYSQALVHNATKILSWCKPSLPPYHSLSSAQHLFNYKAAADRGPDFGVPAGTSCNIAMVAQNCRHFVETSTLFHPLNLLHMTAIRSVLVKLPEREWYHWPALQDTLSHAARPNDADIAKYHAGVLPSNEPVLRFREGLLKRTHVGHQSLKEDTLIRVMEAKPNTTFTARIPVRYRLNHKLIHEICEYDLRTQRLITRKVVTEDEVDAEGFPNPGVPHLTYYNSQRSDYRDSWEEW